MDNQNKFGAPIWVIATWSFLLAIIIIFTFTPLLSNPKSKWILIAIGAGIFLWIIYLGNINILISAKGITSKNIFGEKFIGWEEIDTINWESNTIRLQHSNRKITLIINPHLSKKEEIINHIILKRPDIFPEILSKYSANNLLFVSDLLRLSITIFFIYERSYGLALFSFLTYVPILFETTLRQTKSLYIKEDKLIIQYFFTKTIEIKKEDVLGIVYISPPRAFNSHALTIKTRDDEYFYQSPLGKSDFIMYLILKKWLDNKKINNEVSQ